MKTKMILLHLAFNGKPVILDSESILFAEDCEDKDASGKTLEFTRVFLKQSVPGEEGTAWIDIQEGVEKILKLIR